MVPFQLTREEREEKGDLDPVPAPCLGEGSRGVAAFGDVGAPVEEHPGDLGATVAVVGREGRRVQGGILQSKPCLPTC